MRSASGSFRREYMVGPDPTKRFVQKHSGLIPEGETVLGVVIAESKGGAWRRGIQAGMEAAGPLVSAFAPRGAHEQAHEDAGGDAGSWPEGPAFWLVLTDRQLLVWQGAVGSSKVGPGAARYSLDRIARITVDRKLLISKLSVAFKDGSAVELDLAKQKLKPFMEAAEARLAM
jgi:hypothetical protein